jgi:hypothetical protein
MRVAEEQHETYGGGQHLHPGAHRMHQEAQELLHARSATRGGGAARGRRASEAARDTTRGSATSHLGGHEEQATRKRSACFLSGLDSLGSLVLVVVGAEATSVLVEEEEVSSFALAGRRALA